MGDEVKEVLFTKQSDEFSSRSKETLGFIRKSRQAAAVALCNQKTLWHLYYGSSPSLLSCLMPNEYCKGHYPAPQSFNNRITVSGLMIQMPLTDEKLRKNNRSERSFSGSKKFRLWTTVENGQKRNRRGKTLFSDILDFLTSFFLLKRNHSGDRGTKGEMRLVWETS